MQYLEGETLEQRLEREGSVPLLDAVRITGHIARALRRAHARGIVHRDLKPANIYLCRSDEDEHGWVAKVLDFGVAKTEGLGERATTKPGALLGTPLFMSPEQVQRASLVDHRADLYSLGMCFFNMVSGRYAYDADSFAAVLVAICSQPLPSLGLVTPGLPPAVVAWFERCCARNPDERFQSADEAFQALRAAAEAVGPAGEAAGAQDGTLRGHRAPLSQRNPPLGTQDSASYPGMDASNRAPPARGPTLWLALTLAAAGLVVLGTLAVFALQRARPEGKPPALAGASSAALPKPLPVAEVRPEPEPPVEVVPDATGAPAASVAAPKPRTQPKPARSTPAAPAAPKTRRAPTDLGF
jgi:serine/threonine-protein kinase